MLLNDNNICSRTLYYLLYKDIWYYMYIIYLKHEICLKQEIGLGLFML